MLISFFGGLLTIGWAGIAADYASGARRGRSLPQLEPFGPGENAPGISVIVAACNEAEKLPAAFRTLLAQSYSGPFEIIAVDDRSNDDTPAILDSLAAEAPPDKRVAVLHLTDLPPGWLGKTHALYRGAQLASGEFLLFTDADVHFGPDALSRAVRYADQEKLDHLVAFFRLDLRGFWENAFGLCFSFLFFLRFRPWRVRNPKSSAYLGVGGFNLVRRSAYESIGTHRNIALEVADDMELGRRIKAAGFRSDVVGAGDLVTVRWQEGLSGLMNGLTKNAYAGLGYSVGTLLASVILLLATVVWPFVGMFVARERGGRVAYGLSSAIIVVLGSFHARTGGIRAAYALTLPVSTLLLIVVMFRSAWITERNGGIMWRGTFYPLAELRLRAVPTAPLFRAM